MHTKAIVTGRFAAEKQAVLAVGKLLGSCVHGDHVHTLILNPRERRASRLGGTHKKGMRTRADREMLKNAAAANAVDLQVAPAATADGVEVSAFTGSLADAWDKTGEKDRRTQVQPAQAPRGGIMIAVETSDYVSQVLAVSVLLEYGARDIERADKLWQESKWPGPDPVPLSSLFARSAGNEENQPAALLRPNVKPQHH